MFEFIVSLARKFCTLTTDRGSFLDRARYLTVSLEQTVPASERESTMHQSPPTPAEVPVGYVDLVVARKHRLVTRERGANGERLRAPKCLEDGRPALSRGVLSVH